MTPGALCPHRLLRDILDTGGTSRRAGLACRTEWLVHHERRETGNPRGLANALTGAAD